MSNTSSAISTPDDDAALRRARWRAVLILFLLLAAVAYAVIAIRPALRAYHNEQRLISLMLAGSVAESIETAYTEQETVDPRMLTEQARSFLTLDDSIAFMRIWDRTYRLQVAVTRDQQDAGAGTLPALGAQESLRLAEGRLTDGTRYLAILSLLQLLEDQREITDEITAARRAPHLDHDIVSHLYVLQDDAERMAKTMEHAHPLLSDAIVAMDSVLTALTSEGDSVPAQAAQASGDAESSVSLALEQARAVTGDTPALPSAVTRLAPARRTLLGRWCPVVQGYRVTIPLFVLDNAALIGKPYGYAEVVFYRNPVDAAGTVAGRALPALIFALFAVLFMVVRPRKRHRHA